MQAAESRSSNEGLTMAKGKLATAPRSKGIDVATDDHGNVIPYSLPSTDVLDIGELKPLQAMPSIYEEGKPYLFLGGFGWGWVGYYVKHSAPTRILVAHCSHFRRAGKDYGKLATEGADDNCEWRYEGIISEINTLHLLKVTPYYGNVHRGE
jgi:hypothetical protein